MGSVIQLYILTGFDAEERESDRHRLSTSLNITAFGVSANRISHRLGDRSVSGRIISVWRARQSYYHLRLVLVRPRPFCAGFGTKVPFPNPVDGFGAQVLEMHIRSDGRQVWNM